MPPPAPPEPIAGETRALVLLVAGGRRFALPVERVREVVPAPPCTPLPGSPPWVAGLANVRGRIVTVLELAGRLGLSATPEPPEPRLVLIDSGRRSVGLAVDAAARLLRVAPEMLDAAPDTRRTLGLDDAAACAVGEADGDAFVLLDADRLLQPAFA